VVGDSYRVRILAPFLRPFHFWFRHLQAAHRDARSPDCRRPKVNPYLRSHKREVLRGLPAVTFAPGTSTIEPGITPKSAVTLRWRTFHDAADQAGLSRRYGGIHFRAADLVGRATGNMAAMNAWAKSLTYFDGRMERER
jgi:hypothetical protein